MNKINYILPSLLLGLLLFSGIDLFAGPPCCPFPPEVNDCGGLPPCTDVPVDGGLSALLIAGIAYGAKRVYGKAK